MNRTITIFTLLAFVLLPGCEEKQPQAPAQTIQIQDTAAGFCTPTHPNTPRSQLTGSGEDCDEAKARLKASREWAGNNCTGNADPGCPSGCQDKTKDCVSFPANTSNMRCTPRDVSASICPNKKKYTCELVQPDVAHPIACGCSCI